jgi:hypothetical protein
MNKERMITSLLERFMSPLLPIVNVFYKNIWVRFVCALSLAFLGVYGTGKCIGWLTHYPVILFSLWTLDLLAIAIVYSVVSLTGNLKESDKYSLCTTWTIMVHAVKQLFRTNCRQFRVWLKRPEI